MISKEQVIHELHHIASVLILADPTKEWGGEDESSDGKPGRLSVNVVKILEELPVTWEKDKATFKLSGTKYDYRGVKDEDIVKGWVHAELPGKYKGEDFTLKIYRNDRGNAYTFASGGHTSPRVRGLSQIKSTFEHFFNLKSEKEDSKSTSRLDKLNICSNALLSLKDEIYREAKDIFKGVLKDSTQKISKDTANHNIYIRYPISSESVEDKKEVSNATLDRMTEFVTDSLSKNTGYAKSDIAVKSVFKEVKDNKTGRIKEYAIIVTIKF